MVRPDIVRVWGTADEFDIEFTKCGGRWVCSLPPDLEDGQYASSIYAMNDLGETAYWAGILYMLTGHAHLDLHGEEYTLWLQSDDYSITLSEDTAYIAAHEEATVIALCPEIIKICFKECGNR